MSIGVRKDGQRVYLTGDTYPVRDRIKAAGGHWDGDRRAWWLGAAKFAQAQAIAAAADATEAASRPPDRAPDDARVYGKAEYKGRTYYVIAEARDGSRRRLATLDGTACFWADAAAAPVVKSYQPREYRGRREYQTFGGLRRFVERQRDPATRTGTCTECGARGPCGHPCPECGGEGSYA